jgi:NitT/TauT family transport system substrate-binding protein
MTAMMTKKRIQMKTINSCHRVMLGVAALSFLCSFGFCRPAAGSDSLRFGLLPVVDTLPLLVAQQEGYFAAQGIALEPISFQSALERDAALQAGQLDGYFGDLLNTLLLIQSGAAIRIITTAYHTHPQFRMFGIAAAPTIGPTSMEDLKAKTVAISRATIIEYLLDCLLASRNLPPDYVEKQEIKKIPIRLQLLLSDQVPAALLPEPLLTLAESKGARVLLDDRSLEMTETVLALDQKWLEGRRDLAGRFLAAYGKAVARINQRPEDFKPLLVERTQFPESVKERYQVPLFPPVGLPSIADVDATQKWLLQNQLITRRLPYERIVCAATP